MPTYQTLILNSKRDILNEAQHIRLTTTYTPEGRTYIRKHIATIRENLDRLSRQIEELEKVQAGQDPLPIVTD